MGRKIPAGAELAEQGSVLVIIAFSLVMLCGFAALAIDGNKLRRTSNHAQVTADAAALAAASQLPDASRALLVAQDYAEKNMPAAKHGNVLNALDVEIGKWDPISRSFIAGGFPTDAAKVTIRKAAANGNAVGLTLGKAVGVDEADVVASAVASFGTGVNWDVVITQDITGSFTAELSDAILADQALLACLNDHAGPDSQVGLAVYTGWGKPMHPMAKIKSAYGSLASTLAGIGSCSTGSMPPCSGTNIGDGLEEAVGLMLSVPAAADTGRAIVLVTDGKPSASSKGADPGMSSAQLAAKAVLWADNAAAAGIDVYTVFYDEHNDATASAFLAGLVRGDGIFMSTPDPAQLPDLLLNICAQLPLRIVD